MSGPAHYFDHGRLDVYRVAIEFAVWRRSTVRRLPKGNGDLADQLARASTSIVLNIAEGSGETSDGDHLHFFRIARRSATECAAALDLISRVGLAPRETLAPEAGDVVEDYRDADEDDSNARRSEAGGLAPERRDRSR